MKHSLSQFMFGLKSASAPLRSDFGILGMKAKQNCHSTTQSWPRLLVKIRFNVNEDWIKFGIRIFKERRFCFSVFCFFSIP